MSDFYAGGLGRMVRCATVSHKESYDDTEFAKLRAVVEELFPRFCGRAERTVFGDDCWLYRLPGRDGSRPVLLMNHHDVAEVKDEAEWTHPPFSGILADGAVWGRGTVDTKGPLYAQLQALEELLGEGWTPPWDLYLLSSHNEEIAGDGAPRAAAWCAERGITFAFVLDEGGAILDAPMPGLSQKCAMVAVHEKGRCRVKCRAEEAASHGGFASGSDTPVVRMARLIAHMAGKLPFPKKLYPEVAAMFTALAPHMRYPLRFVFSHLGLFGPLVVRLMPKLNPQAGGMVGTQCSFSRVEGSTAAHFCTAEAVFRYVREEDLARDLEAFRTVAERYGVAVEVEENEYHRPADLKSPALAYVKKCVEAVFPDVLCAPYLLPAGTDGRHFSDLSSAVLRFAPVGLTARQFASVHGRDENLSVSALEKAVKFYRILLQNDQ